MFLGAQTQPRNIFPKPKLHWNNEKDRHTNHILSSTMKEFEQSHILIWPTIVSPCCSCPCIFSEMTSLSTHHLGYRYLKYQSNSFSHPWMHKLTKLRARVIWSFQCLLELRLGSIMTKDSIHKPHIHESKISSRNKRNLFGLLQQLNGLTRLHHNFRPP